MFDLGQRILALADEVWPWPMNFGLGQRLAVANFGLGRRILALAVADERLALADEGH